MKLHPKPKTKELPEPTPTLMSLKPLAEQGLVTLLTNKEVAKYLEGKAYMGQTIEGHPIFLDDRARSPLVLLRGSSGMGKSRLLVAIIIQDIIRPDVGVMLLDPGGSVMEGVLEAVASRRSLVIQSWEQLSPAYKQMLSLDKVLDKYDARYRFYDFGTMSKHGHRYNPIYVHKGFNLERVVQDFMSGLERAFGGDLTQTRRLNSIVSSFSKVVAAFGGTPLDILNLLVMDPSELNSVIEKLDNRANDLGHSVPEDAKWYIQQFFSLLKQPQRLERAESTVNALRVFLTDPAIYELFSCPGEVGTIDFSNIWCSC